MTDIVIGFTDYTKTIFIPDPASTDGSGKTGLVAANLTVSYVRVETDNDVTVTDVTSSLNDLAALTTAHTDWGIKEISSALAPGLYRLDIADAVFATGATSAVVYVMITTSAAAASPMEFTLKTYGSVWDEPRASHTTSGTFGEVLEDLDLADAILDDVRFTTVAADIDAIGTDLNGIAAAVSDIPTNEELTTALATADDAVLAAIASLALEVADIIKTDDVIDGTITDLQFRRIILSILAGKLAISGATVTTRDVADTKARGTFTTTASGERTAVTLDGT